MGLLSDILTRKAAEVAELSASPPKDRAASAPRDVLAALRRGARDPLRLIAEIKFRSPSAGELSRSLGATERARAYASGGAAMISVLTDRTWFDGSFDDLSAARAAVPVPILCKDFVIDLAQIDYAWSAGADAVLLIVRCLRQGGLLPRLVEGARTRGIEPFVEVVDEHELQVALAAGARVIGVNARDLDTLVVDTEQAKRVLASIPADRVAVHLSGLRSGTDAGAIAASRADAALIGEALMRCDDPGPLLGELVRGAGSAEAKPSKS